VGGTTGQGAEVMLSLSATTRVYMKPGATDLRGGFERLYQLARTGFGQDPLSGGQVFAFCNQRRTRLKLLFHDSTGLWICTKRHAPHCTQWFRQDSLPLSPALWEGDRSSWFRCGSSGCSIY
jgi:transposase